MTQTEFLKKELENAQEFWEWALADSGHASARSQYWVGYMDAINNALHNLEGMGE